MVVLFQRIINFDLKFNMYFIYSTEPVGSYQNGNDVCKGYKSMETAENSRTRHRSNHHHHHNHRDVIARTTHYYSETEKW
jgi:hypothetical protein